MFDEDKVKKLLSIPEDLRVVAITPIVYEPGGVSGSVNNKQDCIIGDG